MTRNPILSLCLAGLLACTPAIVAAGAAPHGEAPLARSPGKPNAGLTITSGDRYQLEAGRTQTVTLSLAGAPEGMLYLTVSTSDPALELLSPARYEFDLGQEPEPSVELELLPHGDGRYYLMLNAELTRTHQPSQTQALGVMVQVGDAQPKLQKTQSTGGVISLPARETIRD